MRALVLLLLLVMQACRREPVKRERTEPWPAPLALSSSPRAGIPTAFHYEVEAGNVTFGLPWGGGHARGSLSRVEGTVDLDLADLQKTSGRIRADLESLQILSEAGVPDPPSSLGARQALGLRDDVPTAAREAKRHAVFSLRSLERVAHGDFLVLGDLALSGIRAPERVEVSTSPPLHPGEIPPERITVRSTNPLTVSLGTHDIRPERGPNVPLARPEEPRDRKRAASVSVSFDLVLTRRP